MSLHTNIKIFCFALLLAGAVTHTYASVPTTRKIMPEISIIDIHQSCDESDKLYMIVYSDGTPYVERGLDCKYEVPVYNEELSAVRAAIILQEKLKAFGKDRKIKVKVFMPKAF